MGVGLYLDLLATEPVIDRSVLHVGAEIIGVEKINLISTPASAVQPVEVC